MTMTKPTPTTKKKLDWNECVNFIEEKYKINIRDYKGKHDKDYYQIAADQLGYDKMFFNGKWQQDPTIDKAEGRAKWNEISALVATIQPEYCDFWHLICDDVSNGSYMTLNMEYLDYEEGDEDGYPVWGVEILKMFHDEFKEHIEFYGIEFWVEW